MLPLARETAGTRQLAQEQAMKLPVKILFPMVVFILLGSRRRCLSFSSSY